MITETTVTVAKKHISRLIETIIRGISRRDHLEPQVRAAAASVLTTSALPPNPDDPVTLPADLVWWLHHGSYALGVYRLDETADATYEHPAVVAEVEVQKALLEQAPDVCDELDEHVDAEIAAVLSTLRAHDAAPTTKES